MNNEKNVVEDFLGNLKGDESNDPFTKDVEDPFASSTREDKKEESGSNDSDEDSKPLPYHEDPKLQRYIQKEVKRLTSQNRPSATPSATENFVRESAKTNEEADEILTRIIGNDTPEKRQAVSDFKKYLSSIKEEARQGTLNELQQREQAERVEETQAQEELLSGFENIEDQFGVDLTSRSPRAEKIRSDFVDFIRRVSPKDGEGNVVAYPDLVETFTLFQDSMKRTTNTNSRAKDLSSRSMARSAEAKASPTPADQSWKGVERELSRLGQ
jgi:hypothetical protein